jgi:hypothetical protein
MIQTFMRIKMIQIKTQINKIFQVQAIMINNQIIAKYINFQAKKNITKIKKKICIYKQKMINKIKIIIL